MANALQLSPGNERLRIVELGTGCGIVSFSYSL
jgi:methylase of polypeptide subunit release factors